ncbi:MAG TPA: S-layer homology domain-containing protein [Candidatus Aquicultor sp.]
MTVSVTADTSGSRIIGGVAIWKSPSGKMLNIDLSEGSNGSVLTGLLHINAYAEPGLWKCLGTEVYDDSGHVGTSNENDDFSAANLTVHSEHPDIVAPTVGALKLSSHTVRPGDVLYIKVKAADNYSGVDSGFISWAQSESHDGGEITANLTYNAASKMLEAAIIVPDEVFPGEMALSYLRVVDKAGNQLEYGLDNPEDPTQKAQVIDPHSATITVDTRNIEAILCPPVIISPTGGDKDTLKLSDENAEKPGIQITIKGLAVPGYKVRLESGGKLLAEKRSGLNGVWSAQITVSGQLREIYAYSLLPNGLRSKACSKITRVQAAKLVMKLNLFSPTIDPAFKGYFKDVPRTNPYVHYIETAVNSGTFTDEDTSTGMFRPNDTLTRLQLLDWISFNGSAAGAEDLTGDTPLDTPIEPSAPAQYKGYFGDVPESDPHALQIENMYAHEYISGNPNGTFHPNDPISASLVIAGFPNIGLRDVSEGWYTGYVFDLSIAGVIGGTGTGFFDPNRKVTKAEFAKMVCKSLGWEPTSGEASKTVEVQPSHWAYPYIKTLSEKGVLAYAGGSYKPGEYVTRAEAVRLVVIAGILKFDTTGERFPDIVGHTDTEYILTGRKYGIVSGYPDGTFAPDTPVSRCEAAKFIWILQRNLLP